jgi:hypothetical protein
MKDECETFWPKCVWRMMQFLRSRTKISEIAFGVLQIGGSIWNLQRENDINREKKMAAITTFQPGDISRNVPPLRDVRGRRITKCPTFPWRRRETYRNSSWTRDVNEPMAFTEIYLRYEITKCPTFAWRRRETYHEMSHLCVTSEGDISKFFMNTWRKWANGIHGNLLEVWDNRMPVFLFDLLFKVTVQS